jgi:hypothetical protein
MPSVLSFDIGTRNLAVCWLSGQSSGELLVHYWRLLDISSSVPGQLCQKKVGRGTCKRPGKYLSAGDERVCKQHCDVVGRKKLAERTDDKARSQQSVVVNAINFMDTFLKLPSMESVTHSVIEIQSKRSPLLQLVSHVLYTQLVKRFGNAVPVDMVTAACKDGIQRKKKYAERKKDGVERCALVLRRKNVSVEAEARAAHERVVAGKGKLDDYADAFLQGLFFVKRQASAVDLV